MIGEVKFYSRRIYLFRHEWRLVFEHNGVRDLIAQGTTWRRKRAWFAAQSWHRVWLRKHGQL